MPSSEAKKAVQFRLSPELYEELERLGRQKALSAGLMACELVTQALTVPPASDNAELMRLFAAQAKSLAELRKDLRLAVEALLVAANMDPDEAKDWVRENLPAS